MKILEIQTTSWVILRAHGVELLELTINSTEITIRNSEGSYTLKHLYLKLS